MNSGIPRIRWQAASWGTVVLCVCMLVARPGQAADEAISRASEEVGACFSREDPACARPWIAKLEKLVAGSQAVAYARGQERFLSGDFVAATKLLAGVASAKVVPSSLRKRAKHDGDLAVATRNITAHMIRKPLLKGRYVVTLQSGPDEVLLPLMTPVLERAEKKLRTAFGPLPSGPLHIHIYRRVEDLAAVSGLTVKQIRDSGTIALCKYNRLMLTSPNDLLFGYGWADTLVHEMIHWVIIRKAGAGVPIWLHEGLARSFEGTWRGSDPLALSAEELAILHKARRRKRFIPFSKMSPTMAALPDQDATQLAFAEVHHAVGWILARVPGNTADQPLSAQPILARFRAGDDEAKTVQAVLGTPRKKALAQWKKDLRAGIGARGPLPKTTVKPAQKYRFKRVRGSDPFVGMGSAARRWVELGDRLLAIERPLAAVIEYRKALSSGAKRSALLVRRMARALVQLKKHKEAEEWTKEALSRYPDDANLLLLRAAALHGLGKNKQALQLATQSSWINPYDPDLHALMSLVHAALGQPKEAQASKALFAIVAPTAGR